MSDPLNGVVEALAELIRSKEWKELPLIDIDLRYSCPRPIQYSVYPKSKPTYYVSIRGLHVHSYDGRCGSEGTLGSQRPTLKKACKAIIERIKSDHDRIQLGGRCNSLCPQYDDFPF